MALSVAHMSLEIVKQQQRDIMAQRAEKRVQELEAVRKVIQRKKDSAILDYIFFFQLFLAGAFVSAMYYA